MRIIAGEWRGRKLDAPAGLATRPTADRVRETVFSMLVSRVGSLQGLRVADLFAGSGALGFEAMSRGAATATFVDQDRTALDTIRNNAARLGAGDRIRVIPGSALALPQSEPFDLIFADPPYAPGSGSAAIAAIGRAGWLSPGGWLCVETARGEAVDAGPYELVADRHVGRAKITLLRCP
jgi:16S rRNA (guanine966-N2)-methyltransferase